MEKITPHLWFDKQAREAAGFYTSLFSDSRITSDVTIHDTPSGDADIVDIELAGHAFTLINAGPLFKFNPSISFMVACSTAQEVDQLWQGLSQGGQALMELGEYPFSKRYGWLQDKYGLSWQIAHTEGPSGQKITPSLMFVGEQCGRAEEAMTFWTSIFRSSRIGDIARYPKGREPEREGTVMFAGFTLEGQEFAAMDSARAHAFGFNEAISLMVHCESQQEIDHYWEKLSADPRAEQCGWLKDRFGVSWQIVPTRMDEMLRTADKATMARVTKAFLKMKKFDVAELERAYAGVPATR